MRATKAISIVQQELISLTCDKCKKLYPVGDDEFEIQEFHYIGFRGGYASVFGDGTDVRCDICQRCLHEMIKNFMVTTTIHISSTDTPVVIGG